MRCTLTQALDRLITITARTSILTRFYFLGGSPFPRMDGRNVVSLLQQGYRMQKPEHLDNELLVAKLFISWFRQFSGFNDSMLASKRDLKSHTQISLCQISVLLGLGRSG